jgi:hypothetical protein
MRRSLGRLALCVLALAAAGGCRERPARTPEEASRRLAMAVQEGDGARLYWALDQQSRWSVISVQRYYREMGEIVRRAYPPERQARELERIVGADERRPERFFSAQNQRHGWLARLGPAPGAVVRTERAPGRMVMHTAGGRRLEFVEEPPRSWGFSGWRSELEELKRRASHDLEMTRENASVYERAAGEQGQAPP